MKTCSIFTLMFCLLMSFSTKVIAEEPNQEKPIPKITPGKVIVPFQRMRRIWGELESVDLETRTGTFRAEGDDKVMHFNALPYAEMLHHATFGDLKDFRIGERAIFRMHEDEAGEWTWLTYIQDEMNMLNGHKEYYFVDAINAEDGELEFTQAKEDKSFVREEGLILKTDQDTNYWKNGKPASFSDIQVGDKLRAKTHGTGKGRVRVAWHVFLDDHSLIKFQDEQKEVHAERMNAEGLPGYVDRVEGNQVDLTIFQEGKAIASSLKKGQTVRLAVAGQNRKPTMEALNAKVIDAKVKGKLVLVQLIIEQDIDAFEVTNLVRLFVP